MLEQGVTLEKEIYSITKVDEFTSLMLVVNYLAEDDEQIFGDCHTINLLFWQEL